jgi:hypothetical protein
MQSRSSVSGGTNRLRSANKPVAEVYGAHITKPAETLPKGTLKGKRARVGKPLPRPRYNIGEIVGCARLAAAFGWNNGRIVGMEWGEYNKNIMRPMWYYNLTPTHGRTTQCILVAEDEIRDRISV